MTMLYPICVVLGCVIKGLYCIIIDSQTTLRERSGSVVECLTLDRGAAGSSLTVGAFCNTFDLY